MRRLKNMVIFDTNMILRYLLDDDPKAAARAEQYLQSGNVSVTVEVIAEAVYVLNGVYGLDRPQIAETLKGFLNLVHCDEMDVLISGLDAFSTHNLDFVDCVLYAYHAVRGIEIATLDKKLQKLMKGH